MNRTEKLQEQYEDALFALMMDGIAVSEGEAALEEMERLAADPDFCIPESCVLRGRQTIENCARGYRRKKRIKRTKRTFKRILMVAVISMLLFATAMMASASLRMKVVNYAYEIFSDHMRFGFVEEAAADTGASAAESGTFTVGWIPEGYVLEDSGGNIDWLRQTYYNADTDGVIDISVFDGEENTANIDIENAEVQNLTIRGMNGKLIEKDNWAILVLVDLDNRKTVEIQCNLGEGETIFEENLVKIAENLVF